MKSPKVNYKHNTSPHSEKLMYQNQQGNNLKEYNWRNLNVRCGMHCLLKISVEISGKCIK